MTREEAINEIKSWDFLEGKEIEAIHTLIPQLRESEDERIWKELVAFYKNMQDSHWHEKYWHDLEIDHILAYLEKQKEQKPEQTSEEREYVRTLKALICDFIRDNYKTTNVLFYQKIYDWLDGRHIEQKPVEYLSKDKVYAIMTKLTNLSYSNLIPLNSDEYKKINEITSDVRSLLDYPIEQKPTERSLEDDHIIGFVYDLLNEIEWKEDWAMSKDECLRLLSNYIPQKPGEWSEEDELNCNRIIRFLEPHKTFFPKKETKEEMKNWLENRLKSLSPQPKQEWSEEDKAIVNCIACCLDGSFVPEAARKQCLEWFNKHRRDFLNSHSWKPSEEQMNILKAIKDYVGKGSGYWGEGLGSLIEDLEKLR